MGILSHEHSPHILLNGLFIPMDFSQFEVFMFLVQKHMITTFALKKYVFVRHVDY